MWSWNKTPKVTEKEIQRLKDESELMVARMKEFEKATLDGEDTWMLIKCKKPEYVDHPVRRKGDRVCVT